VRNLLILFFSLFHFSLFSQEVVNLRFDNIDIKDSIEIVIWEMDWDNKLVSDRPIYKSIIGFNSVIFFYPGHYNISYTNGTFIYYMFNLHIKSDLSYYREGR